MRASSKPHLRRAIPDPANAEMVPADDRIIGRAFRWSLPVLLLSASLAGAWLWRGNHRASVKPARITPMAVPFVPQPEAAGEMPRVAFTDVTVASGLTFVHRNGAYGQKLLPETMGGGVAFFDANEDGFPDLLFVNGTDWPWHESLDAVKPSLALYLNDGHGQFRDATAGSGLEVRFYGMGIAVGDYDNDGLVDVFISGVGGGRLFHNEGNARFVEVTAVAGVGGAQDDWSTACAWFDYDNDGKLDLFVANYVKWSREIDLEVGYSLVGQGRAFGPPLNFAGAFPHLYHNDGNGHFTEVTAAAGLQIRNPSTQVPAAKTLGVAVVDLDGDGWLDLVLANDTVPNFVFHNQRNGTFQEIGAVSGAAFDAYGNTRGAMGIDAAHYRNTSALGLAIGNFANEMTALYVSQSDPLQFVDESIAEGLGPASRLALKFGIFFFDYDLDGYLDLLSCNGHLEEEIHKIQASQTYAQAAQLFWNGASANHPAFLLVPPEKAGLDLFKPMVGRGGAFADIDGDGDLDVILTQIGGPPLLLRNEAKLGHHWLRLKLQGTRSNRDAIGARLWVSTGDLVLPREVMPTRGYLSQSELTVTVGLGQHDRVDAVEVHWPSGQKQFLHPNGVDRLLTLVEP